MWVEPEQGLQCDSDPHPIDSKIIEISVIQLQGSYFANNLNEIGSSEVQRNPMCVGHTVDGLTLLVEWGCCEPTLLLLILILVEWEELYSGTSMFTPDFPKLFNFVRDYLWCLWPGLKGLMLVLWMTLGRSWRLMRVYCAIYKFP